MRRPHPFIQGNHIDQEANSHFGSAESSLAMEPSSDHFKRNKRMRPTSNRVAEMARMWDTSREDACRLELAIGPAVCANTTSFGQTPCIDNESSCGLPFHVMGMAFPSATASMRRAPSICPMDRIDVAASLGSTTSFSERPLSAGSWNSTDSMHINEPMECSVLPEVELGLGLNVVPNTSSADSTLTSSYPASINHMDASSTVAGFVNLETPASSLSFMYQEGSLYNVDVPMIDEGSTSNGSYILPLLKSRRIPPLDARAPSLGAQTYEPNFLTGLPGVAEKDVSMSFKASSVTISNSAASSVERTAKICKFTGCAKRARGASGLCISHGGGRRCQRLGCNKGAEGSTIFCKAHGGGRRCESLGCTKSAEGKTEFCIAHGGGSRCSFDGCTKAARGRTGFCIRHGGGKRCKKEGCTKSAEGYSALCIAHGGGKRCQYPNCNKGAQGSTLLCKGHGGGKRCTVEGCNKGAEGSTSLCKGHGGGKRCMFEGGGMCSKSVHGGTPYCVAHGGGKRCIVQGCTKSARGRTDSCVKHGGGKRCKFENCDKSAQGSTDFCKAHGGGKRCTWGQEGDVNKGYDFGEGSCERYAKGKLSLCMERSALVQDQRVHGTGAVGGVLSLGADMGSSYMELASSSHKEENFLSFFNASRHVPQAVSGGSLMEGVEMPFLRSCVSLPSFPRGGDRTHFQGLQLSQSPSMQGAHDGKSYPSCFPKLLSKTASMSQSSVSSQMFGLATSMQWPAGGRQNEQKESGLPHNMEEDVIFNMSSLSLPEERVHGGNIMALLSGKTPK